MGLFEDVAIGNGNGNGNGNSTELIPVGIKLNAVISEFGWVETSTGGKRANVKADIVDGEYAGRCIYDSINLLCTSNTAKAIALQQFRALCVSVGSEALFEEVYTVNSEEELDSLMEGKVPSALIDRIIEITVGVEKGSNGYSDRNKIKTYSLKPNSSFHQPPAADNNTITRPGWMK